MRRSHRACEDSRVRRQRAGRRALLLALVLTLLGAQAVHAMQFKCVRQGAQPILQVSDKPPPDSEGVVADDVKRLRTELAKCRGQSRATPIVDLHSGGGDMRAGIDMGRDLLSAEVHTRISPGNACVSACTFIFLGGRYREVMPGGSFQPHGFSGWKFDDDGQLFKPNKLSAVLYIHPELWRDARAYTKQLCGYLPGFAEGLRPVADWCLGMRFDPDTSSFIPPGVATGKKGLDGLSEADIGKFVVVALLARFIATPMMELERDVALRHLRDGSVGEIDQRHYVAWIVDNFGLVAQMYLNLTKSKEKLAKPDPQLAVAIGDLVKEVMTTATDGAQQIKGFLAERRKDDEINADALTKLMFSTSIIYTRPLTSKEMCRAGVVTIAIDC